MFRPAIPPQGSGMTVTSSARMRPPTARELRQSMPDQGVRPTLGATYGASRASLFRNGMHLDGQTGLTSGQGGRLHPARLEVVPRMGSRRSQTYRNGQTVSAEVSFDRRAFNVNRRVSQARNARRYGYLGPLGRRLDTRGFSSAVEFYENRLKQHESEIANMRDQMLVRANLDARGAIPENMKSTGTRPMGVSTGADPFVPDDFISQDMQNPFSPAEVAEQERWRRQNFGLSGALYHQALADQVNEPNTPFSEILRRVHQDFADGREAMDDQKLPEPSPGQATNEADTQTAVAEEPQEDVSMQEPPPAAAPAPASAPADVEDMQGDDPSVGSPIRSAPAPAGAEAMQGGQPSLGSALHSTQGADENTPLAQGMGGNPAPTPALLEQAPSGGVSTDDVGLVEATQGTRDGEGGRPSASQVPTGSGGPNVPVADDAARVQLTSDNTMQPPAQSALALPPMPGTNPQPPTPAQSTPPIAGNVDPMRVRARAGKRPAGQGDAQPWPLSPTAVRPRTEDYSPDRRRPPGSNPFPPRAVRPRTEDYSPDRRRARPRMEAPRDPRLWQLGVFDPARNGGPFQINGGLDDGGPRFHIGAPPETQV